MDDQTNDVVVTWGTGRMLSPRCIPLGLAVAWLSCATMDGLDPRIPIDAPGGGIARYSTPRILIGDDGIQVVTLSMPSGRLVKTAAALRLLLVRLPVADWPNGRHVAVNPPSLGPWSPEVHRYLHDALATLAGLGVDVQVVSQP